MPENNEVCDITVSSMYNLLWFSHMIGINMVTLPSEFTFLRMAASFSSSLLDMMEILVASITYTTQWIFSCRDAGLEDFFSSG